MDPIEAYCRRIGSHAAMEKRQDERAAGKLNAPLRGPRGLGNVVQAMSDRKPHPLKCKCAGCIPDWLREEMQTWPVVTPGMYNASPRPVTKIESKSAAPKRRRGKWNQRGTSGN